MRYSARLAVLASVVFLCAIASPRAFSHLSDLPSIRATYRQADAIVLAWIENATPQTVDGVQCGTSYNAALVSYSVFKEERSRVNLFPERFAIGRGEGLEVGREYLLFLRWVAEPGQEYQRAIYRFPTLTATHTKAQALSLAKCNGLVPGYMFNEAWKVDHGGVYVSGYLGSRNVPRGVHVEYEKILLTVLREKDVLAYLRKLGRGDDSLLDRLKETVLPPPPRSRETIHLLPR